MTCAVLPAKLLHGPSNRHRIREHPIFAVCRVLLAPRERVRFDAGGGPPFR